MYKQKGIVKIYNCSMYLLTVLIGFILANFIFNFIDQILLKEDESSKSSIKEIIIPTKEEKPSFFNREIAQIEIKRRSPETLKLNGIFYDSINSYVLINNRILKKGDCLKDYCIKEIFPDKVQLECEGEIIELKM
jgi:5-methylthioribose kinase